MTRSESHRLNCCPRAAPARTNFNETECCASAEEHNGARKLRKELDYFRLLDLAEVVGEGKGGILLSSCGSAAVAVGCKPFSVPSIGHRGSGVCLACRANKQRIDAWVHIIQGLIGEVSMSANLSGRTGRGASHISLQRNLRRLYPRRLKTSTQSRPTITSLRCI